MKLLVVLCLVAVAYAAPPFDSQVLRLNNDNIGVGDFKYGFELSDGSKQDAVGELKNEGREGQAVVISGSYSWVAPNNVRYTVKYVADEYGYRSTLIEEGIRVLK